MIYDSQTGLIEFEYCYTHEKVKWLMQAALIDSVREAYANERNQGFLSVVYYQGRDTPVPMKESYASIKAALDLFHKKGPT